MSEIDHFSPDEEQQLTLFAHGRAKLVCTSYNDVRRIRRWLKKNYPYLRVRQRTDARSHGYKVRLTVKVGEWRE